MLSGSIYHSNHMFLSFIFISNVTITIVVHDTFPIFWFASTDVVNISNMTVFYSFDTNKLCNAAQNVTRSIESIWGDNNETCLRIWCLNPPSLIINEGHLVMQNITIDSTSINPPNNNSCIQYCYDRGYTSFIENKRDMYIEDMFVTRSISTVFLLNEGYLHVNALYFEPISNLNALHSRNIINQRIDGTILSLNNSKLYGSHTQIYAIAGEVFLIKMTFGKLTEQFAYATQIILKSNTLSSQVIMILG
eukprot:61972_1